MCELEMNRRNPQNLEEKYKQSSIPTHAQPSSGGERGHSGTIMSEKSHMALVAITVAPRRFFFCGDAS